MIIRKKIIHGRQYLTTFKTLAEDPALSDKARGLYMRLPMVPDGEDCTIKRFACTGRDGESAIRSAIKELEKSGHIRIEWMRSPQGKITGNQCFLTWGGQR